MKPISIKLDRLLANTSIEQIRGKLVLVSTDQTRIILELKNKRLKTVLGPFDEADWEALAKREVIVFLRPDERPAVFDAKLKPRERNSAKSDGEPVAKTRTSRKAAGEPARKGPLTKWAKFAEGRMVGEPVKHQNILKGFDLEAPFLDALLAHLEIVVGQNTKVIAYLDFRKLYHFMGTPEYRAFEAEHNKA